MDPQFQRSFIPKKPIMATAPKAPSSISLFSLLATVLFILSLALAGLVFSYGSILHKQIASNKASLERAKGAFEPDLINQIVRLDSRIETSKKLVASHIAVTPFFDFLSSVTLKTVRFRDFTFTYLATDKILVSMKGQALSYAAVALESDLLTSQKQLKNTLLSDMSLEPAGTVSFSVSTTLNPSMLSYAASLVGTSNQNNQQTQAPAPVATPAAAVPAGTSTPKIKTQ